ncbi:hypothetical protein ACIHFC_29650 [Streptomyces sp. NPDC052013]|uniref:hypothetical protein n=1 Tax=Streptomyces sp. NPDC052013 TaxID=3365679 RepID=UPI0037D08578
MGKFAQAVELWQLAARAVARPPVPGSRRSQRQRARSELRAQGRYGPEFRDVLPAFVGLGLAVLAPVLLLAWLYRALGVGGLALGAALLAAAAAVGLRWRRTVVRRRGGHYTPAELARLDDRGLVVAAARMLRRDGWRVVDLTAREGRPRLYARDRRGRELDVAVRPVASAAATDEDEGATGPAPLREAGRPGVDRLIRLVVHLGTFSRADVLWASRQGGVHLLDGRQLQRWASGATLDDLGLSGH